MDPLDRRTFLQRAGGAAAAGALATLPRAARAATSWGHGFLVESHDPGATADDKEVVPGRAVELLDRALARFTGEPDAVRAMGHFVTPADTVGLKVSALGAPHAAFHPVLADRLVDLVQQVGVPSDRILVYDQFGSRMVRAGYQLTDEAGGVRVLHHESPGWGYEAVVQAYDRRRSFRWCRILKRCTAVLNLCVPKDHDLLGVSGALSNMALGNISDPFPLHPVLPVAVPRLYARPEIVQRVRLVVCDATRVVYQGGPQDSPVHRARHNSVLVAVDPVAVDWAIVDMVNRHRHRHDLPPLHEVERPRERPPAVVANAAALGLGAGPRQLQWVRVDGLGQERLYQPRMLGKVRPRSL